MSAFSKEIIGLEAIIANAVDQVVGSVSDNKASIERVMSAMDLTEAQARRAIRATNDTAQRDSWLAEVETPAPSTPDINRIPGALDAG